MRVWLPAIRSGTGADVFTDRLATALLARGIEAEITWFPAWYEFLPELMRLRAVPPGTDVIHANGWLASAFASGRVPLVTTVHHLVHDPAYAPYRSTAQALYHRHHLRWREQRALRQSQAVTAVSSYVAGTVGAFSGRTDVTAIHNWVDTARYAPDPTYVVDPRSPFHVLIVGNSGRRKGFDLLPELASMLGPRFEVRCTGGLRDKSSRSLPGVRMLGRLSEEDLIREYQHCGAVVSLSRYEGFGYTALEAMACGKPFVGFDTSGLRDVVTPGVTGFLEPIDDVGAIAERCMLLARDGDLLADIGRAARRRADSTFGVDAAVLAYIALYEGVSYVE